MPNETPAGPEVRRFDPYNDGTIMVYATDYGSIAAQLKEAHEARWNNALQVEELQRKTFDLESALTEARGRVEELERALRQFADCKLSADNCADFSVANKRIRNLALAALAQPPSPKAQEPI